MIGSGTGRVGGRYRALPVTLPTRVRLRLQARADRRDGLPLGTSPATTPVLQDLLARHGDVCERERTRYLTDVRPLAVRLGRLEAELGTLREAVRAATTEHARTAVLPTEQQLTRRTAGEHDLPESLVRQRRQTEHDRRVAAARAALDRAQSALDPVLAERSELEARSRHRAEVARSRVLRHAEFTRRQAALYRRALVRRHPDAEALVHQWQTDLCPPPAWATSEIPVPSPRAGAAA